MKKDKARGSISIEVVLILVPFMLCFMTVLNLARFVEAEVIVHHAITQTAKEISTYSYVMTKTGITEKMISTNRESSEFRTDVDNTVNSLMELGSAIGSLGSSAEASVMIDTISKDIDTLKSTSAKYISDPKSIATGVFAAVKAEGRQEAMKNIAGQLTMGSIQNVLNLITDDPDSYLENIGIVGGMDGLDFSQTKWLSATEGKGEIKVVVTFTMKNNISPMFDFGEHKFCQCASTLLW